MHNNRPQATTLEPDKVVGKYLEYSDLHAEVMASFCETPTADAALALTVVEHLQAVARDKKVRIRHALLNTAADDFGQYTRATDLQKRVGRMAARAADGWLDEARVLHGAD